MNYSTERYLKEINDLFEKKLVKFEPTDELSKIVLTKLTDEDKNFLPTEVDKKIVGQEMLKILRKNYFDGTYDKMVLDSTKDDPED